MGKTAHFNIFSSPLFPPLPLFPSSSSLPLPSIPSHPSPDESLPHCPHCNSTSITTSLSTPLTHSIPPHTLQAISLTHSLQCKCDPVTPSSVTFLTGLYRPTSWLQLPSDSVWCCAMQRCAVHFWAMLKDGAPPYVGGKPPLGQEFSCHDTSICLPSVSQYCLILT